MDPDAPADAILLGCVKTKADVPLPARDLYRSELWRRRRAFAEASGRPWWVLSAEYGLVLPDTVIAPYDVVMGSLPLARRQELAAAVAHDLELAIGDLSGKHIEIHAGDEYVAAVGPTLRARGALIRRPLQGIRFGPQLAWYGARLGLVRKPVTFVRRPTPALVPTRAGDGRGLGRRITNAFMSGALDLSARRGAPKSGWAGMPEVIAADKLRNGGADDRTVRLFLTFCAAMDRARDADRLAIAAVRLHEAEPWTFAPDAIVRRSVRELADALREYRVSQRHSADAFGWRVLAETLADTGIAPATHAAIDNGHADARDLLAELATTSPAGTPLFPLLSGPKIANLWIRLLAHPGRAKINSLDIVPVAVDVQVRKVTEYLGVTDTGGALLDDVRGVIEATWSDDVMSHGASGPPGLGGTPGALDPALWFYGKWGCTFCERAGRRLPISDICGECRFPATPAGSSDPGALATPGGSKPPDPED